MRTQWNYKIEDSMDFNFLTIYNNKETPDYIRIEQQLKSFILDSNPYLAESDLSKQLLPLLNKVFLSICVYKNMYYESKYYRDFLKYKNYIVKENKKAIHMLEHLEKEPLKELFKKTSEYHFIIPNIFSDIQININQKEMTIYESSEQKYCSLANGKLECDYLYEYDYEVIQTKFIRGEEFLTIPDTWKKIYEINDQRINDLFTDTLSDIVCINELITVNKPSYYTHIPYFKVIRISKNLEQYNEKFKLNNITKIDHLKAKVKKGYCILNELFKIINKYVDQDIKVNKDEIEYIRKLIQIYHFDTF